MTTEDSAEVCDLSIVSLMIDVASFLEVLLVLSLLIDLEFDLELPTLSGSMGLTDLGLLDLELDLEDCLFRGSISMIFSPEGFFPTSLGDTSEGAILWLKDLVSSS